jgi:glutaminyl-tRNA synthetase
LHWVAAAAGLPAEIRLYEPLFNRPDPGADGDLIADLNPRSLAVLNDGRVEPALADTASGETVQFER